MDPNVLTDALIDTIGVAVNKGKKYLYDIAWDEKDYSLTFPFRHILKPSDIASISDLSLSESFFGRINRVAISGSRQNDTFVIQSILGVDRKLTDG